MLAQEYMVSATSRAGSTLSHLLLLFIPLYIMLQK
jgi:hypothetical protein